MHVVELTTDQEHRRAVSLLEQLWEDRAREEMLEWIGADDYTLFGAIENEDIVGVAGVRIEDVLHHRRHAWLDSLVVDEPRRGAGIGTNLLDHVREWARANDCEQVALASPLAKQAVHDFYESAGFETWGYVIETDL